MALTLRRRILPPFLIALAAGIVLARLGPFDTFSDLPPLERSSYWVGLTLLLAAQALVALHLLAAPLARVHWVIVAALAGLISAIPSAFEVAWAESLLRVQRDLGLVDLLAIFGDVILIAVPLTIAMRAAMPERPEPTSAPSLDGAQRLLASLSSPRRGRLIALKAEDHYLRVYTSGGDELILRRFRDALADVAGLEGLQVHRGWWVALDAVDHASSDGDCRTLVLANGVRVPVSRTYALAAREAGLLAD